MNNNRTGGGPQDASRQCVGTSFGIHPEDTPRLTDEMNNAGIDTILISTDPTFLNGVQCGRSEFIALSFEKREIVAPDAEKTLQWAMYDTLRPALWRYGYVCGWNEEFYKYAMKKVQEQTKALGYEREER